MEENAEIEGEAPHCKANDDDNIDPDIDLSYIEEKVQIILGHFRKAFIDDHVPRVTLRERFNDYGTFLPTYLRSTSVLSHPKTPPRDHIAPKAPKILTKEIVYHNTKVPPLINIGSVPSNPPRTQNTMAKSGDVSLKQNACNSSTVVAEKCPLKDESRLGSHNMCNQMTLKFRFKMKPDKIAQKSAAILSGLGLDNSPSLSMGSPEESAGLALVPQETDEDSPRTIIEAMTSLPIPGDAMVSPLHDSLLFLTVKERVPLGRKPAPLLSIEDSPMSINESHSSFENGKQSKWKKVKSTEKSKKPSESTQMTIKSTSNGFPMLANKNISTSNPEGKSVYNNDLKHTPESMGDVAEADTGRKPKVSWEANREPVKGRSTSSLKVELLESISGQSCGKSEKKLRNSPLRRASEDRVENTQKDMSVDLSNGNECKGHPISTARERSVNAVKYKEDHVPEKQQGNQKRPVLGIKNKSKEQRSLGRPISVERKENVRIDAPVSEIAKKNSGSNVIHREKEMHKLKLEKDDKTRDVCKDKLKGSHLERTTKGIDSAKETPISRPIISNLPMEEDSTYGVVLGVTQKGATAGNQMISEVHSNIVSNASFWEHKPAPETVLATTSVLIEENWVCCDSCQSWRLLPIGIKPEQLPDKWLCSMLDWLPGMNRCGISEDETTNAVRAMHQVPIENLSNATTARPISADALNYDYTHKNPSPNQLKKKHNIKEIKNTGNFDDQSQLEGSRKNAVQEFHSKSLKDMRQHHTQSNVTKKSCASKSSKLHKLVLEKHSSKVKEKQIDEGETKHIRMKRKNEADHYGSETHKKSKTEDVLPNSGLDLEKAGRSSITGLTNKANGKDMHKYNEYCLAIGAKDRPEGLANKKGDRAPVSSNVGSVDVINRGTKDGSMRKKKLMDREENKKDYDAFSSHDGKLALEESSESEFTKAKKYKASKIGTKETAGCGGFDQLSKKGMAIKVVSSCAKNDELADIGNTINLHYNQQCQKDRKDIASQQNLDGYDSLGRNVGCGQLSVVVTSSSSKISCSHTTKRNFEDAKGSPVDSVTSSPLKISRSNKLGISGPDSSGKDEDIRCRLSIKEHSRIHMDTEGNVETYQMKTKEKSSQDIHSQSQKLPIREYQNGDANNKIGSKSRMFSEPRKRHLPVGDLNAVEQGNQFPGDMDSEDYCSHKEGASTGHLKNVSKKKPGMVSSFHAKEKDTDPAYKSERSDRKVSVSQSAYPINSLQVPEIDTNRHSPVEEEKFNDVHTGQNGFKSKHKDDDDDGISKRNSIKSCSTKKEIETMPGKKGCRSSSVRETASLGIDKKNLLQQKLNREFDVHNKGDDMEPREGKLEGEAKRIRTLPQSTSRPQKGHLSNGHPVKAFCNGDESKLTKNSADAGSLDETNNSSVNLAPDGRLTSSSPAQLNSSCHSASVVLKEAKGLSIYADRLKIYGRGYESNVAYFQAALKFLHAAALLESASSEGHIHGEMNQIEIYRMTAKLCESCAQEYERCQEMAAAALAYKCLEVAYMRIIYCRHSTVSKDRYELQSTLQMIPQDDSPSSSASDVDNLNNQMAGDKPILSKGTGGNQIIGAQIRPKFARLLDFTQEVSFAMEAAIKSRSAFAATNSTTEEAQNTNYITSVQRVIDFSFQDINEFVRLARLAMEALNRSGFDGTRD